MVFVEKQEQNVPWTFKDIQFCPDQTESIWSMIKEIEDNEEINHWKFIKNSEFNNNHQNKGDKLKTVL